MENGLLRSSVNKNEVEQRSLRENIFPHYNY
jgi:hypothetical protein